MQFLPLLLLAIASAASASFSKRSYSEQAPTSDDNTYPHSGEKGFHGAKPSPYTGGSEAPTDEDSGAEADNEKPCDRRHGPCRHRKPQPTYQAPAYGGAAPAATSTTSCTTGNVLPTSQAVYHSTPAGELANSAIRPTCTTQTVTKTQERIVPTTIVNTQTKVVEKPVTQYQTSTRTVEHVATVTKPVYKTETATVTTTICETKTATRTVEHTVVATSTRRETVTATSTVEHTKVETATVTKTVQQKEYVTQTVTQTVQATPTPAGQLPFNEQKKPSSSYGYTPAPAPAAAAPAKEQKQPYKSGGSYGSPSAGAMPSNDNRY